MWCGFTSRSFVSVIPLYCGNSLWRMLKLGKVFAIEYVVGFLRAPSIGISLTDADHDRNQPGFIFQRTGNGRVPVKAERRDMTRSLRVGELSG